MRQRSPIRIRFFCLLVAAGILLLGGCSFLEGKDVKIRDLEFIVLSEEKIPQELKELMEEKREEVFEFTYTDQGALYICIGYGKQMSGGYSIAVDELYLTEENIHVATTLIGPEAANKKNPVPTYPRIVLKTSDLDKPVIFE